MKKNTQQTQLEVILNYRPKAHMGKWKFNPLRQETEFKSKKLLSSQASWIELKNDIQLILQEKVNNEDFETASILRDKIKQIDEKLNLYSIIPHIF